MPPFTPGGQSWGSQQRPHGPGRPQDSLSEPSQEKFTESRDIDIVNALPRCPFFTKSACPSWLLRAFPSSCLPVTLFGGCPGAAGITWLADTQSQSSRRPQSLGPRGPCLVSGWGKPLPWPRGHSSQGSFTRCRGFCAVTLCCRGTACLCLPLRRDSGPRGRQACASSRLTRPPSFYKRTVRR